MDNNSSKNQAIKSKFVEENVLYLVGELVQYHEEMEDYSLTEGMENFQTVNEDGEKDDNGEYPEIYEYWLVSTWLAGKLIEKGECVNEDWHGLVVWGRQCTGQAILLDGVISEICNELEILEGQKFERND